MNEKLIEQARQFEALSGDYVTASGCIEGCNLSELRADGTIWAALSMIKVGQLAIDARVREILDGA